jgi:hypothetical protein
VVLRPDEGRGQGSAGQRLVHRTRFEEVGAGPARLRRRGEPVQAGRGQGVEQLARDDVGVVGVESGGKQHLVGQPASHLNDVHRPSL